MYLKPPTTVADSCLLASAFMYLWGVGIASLLWFILPGSIVFGLVAGVVGQEISRTLLYLLFRRVRPAIVYTLHQQVQKPLFAYKLACGKP